VRRKRKEEAEASRSLVSLAAQLLPKHLGDYLSEGAEDYAVDAILHGQRKLAD
jgi:hypothetical protein